MVTLLSRISLRLHSRTMPHTHVQCSQSLSHYMGLSQLFIRKSQDSQPTIFLVALFNQNLITLFLNLPCHSMLPLYFFLTSIYFTPFIITWPSYPYNWNISLSPHPSLSLQLDCFKYQHFLWDKTNFLCLRPARQHNPQLPSALISNVFSHLSLVTLASIPINLLLFVSLTVKICHNQCFWYLRFHQCPFANI